MAWQALCSLKLLAAANQGTHLQGRQRFVLAPWKYPGSFASWDRCQRPPTVQQLHPGRRSRGLQESWDLRKSPRFRAYTWEHCFDGHEGLARLAWHAWLGYTVHLANLFVCPRREQSHSRAWWLTARLLASRQDSRELTHGQRRRIGSRPGTAEVAQVAVDAVQGVPWQQALRAWLQLTLAASRTARGHGVATKCAML